MLDNQDSSESESEESVTLNPNEGTVSGRPTLVSDALN